MYSRPDSERDEERVLNCPKKNRTERSRHRDDTLVLLENFNIRPLWSLPQTGLEVTGQYPRIA